MRPPPVRVDDSFRQDFRSNQVRQVHPRLPVDGTARDRSEYLRQCDEVAYATIRDAFPQFTPPGYQRRLTSVFVAADAEMEKS